MSQYPPSLRRRDRSLLTFALGSLFLLTPLLDLWAGPGSPWYGPFLLWLLLLPLGIWNALGGKPKTSEKDRGNPNSAPQTLVPNDAQERP